MNDRTDQTGASGGRLFQNMDEQEQIYAPDQLPGADRPAADEHDTGATGSDLVPGVIPAATAGGVTGETPVGGGPGLIPVVPIRNETSDEAADQRGDL